MGVVSEVFSSPTHDHPFEEADIIPDDKTGADVGYHIKKVDDDH